MGGHVSEVRETSPPPCRFQDQPECHQPGGLPWPPAPTKHTDTGPCLLTVLFILLYIQDPQPYISLFYVVICPPGVSPTRL